MFLASSWHSLTRGCLFDIFLSIYFFYTRFQNNQTFQNMLTACQPTTEILLDSFISCPVEEQTALLARGLGVEEMKRLRTINQRK